MTWGMVWFQIWRGEGERMGMRAGWIGRNEHLGLCNKH